MFEKTIDYARGSLAAASESAIEKAGDKLGEVVRIGVSQAGDEMREVVAGASKAIDDKLDKISQELHSQRQFTKDDVRELVDYAGEKLSVVLDQRIEVMRQQITQLVEEKTEYFKTEIDGFFIKRQVDLARERRRLALNIVLATGAALAVGAVSGALVIGSLLGMVAGYAGGWVDEGLMRLMDVIQSFPAFILALGVVAALGQGLLNILLVVALINIPAYARLMRTQMVALRDRQFVAAARLAGNSHSRIVLRHLLPNTLAPVLAIASLNVGWAILTTAGLSFLGIGVQPPTPEWGQMIASGMTDLGTGVWWTSLFPGAALFVFVLGCNLLGDGVQRLIDPQGW